MAKRNSDGPKNTPLTRNPEERDLDEFLETLSPWQRVVLTFEAGEVGPTPRGQPSWETEQQYKKLLARCPAKLRQYRDRIRKFVLSTFPAVPVGAPPKTQLYREAQRLRKSGKITWPQIARQLTPEEYASDPRKAGEAIRKGVGRLSSPKPRT